MELLFLEALAEGVITIHHMLRQVPVILHLSAHLKGIMAERAMLLRVLAVAAAGHLLLVQLLVEIPAAMVALARHQPFLALP
jgi:hypothetical protein